MPPERGSVDATTTASASADVGETIRAVRDEIAVLAVDDDADGGARSDGAFVVVGKETGVSPEPVSSVAFPSYEAAERARDAAARYRAALRALDPELPAYDLVVCETHSGGVQLATVRESTEERRTNGVPRARQTATLTGERRDEWLRMENAPLVHLAGPEELLDDEFVTRQLRSKL